MASTLHFVTFDGAPSGVSNIAWICCTAATVVGAIINALGLLLMWIGHGICDVSNKVDTLAFSGFMCFVAILPVIPTLIGQLTKITSVMDFAIHFSWGTLVAMMASCSEVRIMCTMSSNCGNGDGTYVTGVVFTCIGVLCYIIPLYIQKQLIRQKDCTVPFPWKAVMGGSGPVPPVPNVTNTTTTAAHMGANPAASAYAPDSGTVLGGYGQGSNTSYGYSGNFENSGTAGGAPTGDSQSYYGSQAGNPSQI